MTRRSGNSLHNELAQAYATWRQPLLRFLQRRLGNRSDAEDATQESFARLAAAGNAPSLEKQRSYLYQIAVNLLCDGARQRQARGPVTMVRLDDTEPEAIPGPAHCPATLMEHRQRLARLELALSELPERQREAFVLHRFDGLTQDEVAMRMGISRRMVVKHLSRAFAYCELRIQYASVEQMESLRACEESRDA